MELGRNKIDLVGGEENDGRWSSSFGLVAITVASRDVRAWI